QTLTFSGTPTGGSFTLAYGPLLSANVNWDASPQTLLNNIQTAMNTLFGANNTKVLSSVLGQYDVVFGGTLQGTNMQPLTVSANNLLGTAPNAVINAAATGFADGAMNEVQKLTFDAAVSS